jgi:uncharacterized protein YodC (DUF2158 family)
MDFKIGDVVQLKSGGPEMTITGIDSSDGTIGCTWFPSEESEPKKANFPPAALTKA